VAFQIVLKRHPISCPGRRRRPGLAQADAEFALPRSGPDHPDAQSLLRS